MGSGVAGTDDAVKVASSGTPGRGPRDTRERPVTFRQLLKPTSVLRLKISFARVTAPNNRPRRRARFRFPPDVSIYVHVHSHLCTYTYIRVCMRAIKGTKERAAEGASSTASAEAARRRSSPRLALRNRASDADGEQERCLI